MKTTVLEPAASKCWATSPGAPSQANQTAVGTSLTNLALLCKSSLNFGIEDSTSSINLGLA